MRICSLLLFLSLSFSVTASEIYKCKVEDKLLYQDTPCPEKSTSNEKIEVKVAGGDNPLTSRQAKLEHAVSLGKIMVGMTPAQVRRAWWQPTSINKSFVAGVAREQWVYRRSASQSQYIYFENGLVTAWN